MAKARRTAAKKKAVARAPKKKSPPPKEIDTPKWPAEKPNEPKPSIEPISPPLRKLPVRKRPAAKKAPIKKPGKETAVTPFSKPLTTTAALAAVIGNKPMPRTEIIRKIWEHIKKNGLQDSANKRMINADAKLRTLFGKQQVSMFDLAKIISKNVK